MLKQLVMGLSARQRPDEKLSLDDNELRSALSDIHRSGHHDVSNPLNTTKPQEDTDTVKPGLLSLVCNMTHLPVYTCERYPCLLKCQLGCRHFCISFGCLGSLYVISTFVLVLAAFCVQLQYYISERDAVLTTGCPLLIKHLAFAVTEST